MRERERERERKLRKSEGETDQDRDGKKDDVNMYSIELWRILQTPIPFTNFYFPIGFICIS